MKLDLLSPGIEVGLVTTNLDAMVAFYEGFLELEFQGEIEFPGGSQRRYSLGGSVLKLVTFTAPPPLPATPGGGRAAGRRPVLHDRGEGPDRVVRNLRRVAVRRGGAAHRVRAGAGDGLDVRRRSRRQLDRTVRHAVGMTTPPQTPTCYRHPDRATYVRCTRCNRYICPECMRDAAVGHQCAECVDDRRQDGSAAADTVRRRAVRPPRWSPMC